MSFYIIWFNIWVSHYTKKDPEEFNDFAWKNKNYISFIWL